ncbi:MAG: tyrosine-type recombinase/integrase [Bryobacteraceae bacterium]|nr:tyrosine-type recombinase/integrase [Bryobacteraceae bacterium]
MGRQTIDIHNYERKYNDAERLVRASAISERNKDLILSYRDTCLLKNICGKVRLIRAIGALLLCARTINKDFDTLTKADLEHLVARLLARTPSYSAETMGTYRAILRTFMTFVLTPEQFPTKHPPAILSWLNSHVKTKDKRKLERADLLTPSEIQQLLQIATHPRDKALISTLWETGGRIAEIGNRTIKQLVKHQFGYTLDVTGKTGQRSPLLISSAPYLSQWLACHPFVHDPAAPLWVYNHHRPQPRHLTYQALRMLLRRYVERAGINKRIYPHLFRHSRATYCVATGLMNEQQAKAYFGWSPSSKMLANYAHLTAQDANNAIMRENHLSPPVENHEVLTPKQCNACTTMNTNTTAYCIRCSNPLDERAARTHATTQTATHAVLLQLCKVLVEKGLIDEAAATIHDAGLGEALRELATKTP